MNFTYAVIESMHPMIPYRCHLSPPICLSSIPAMSKGVVSTQTDVFSAVMYYGSISSLYIWVSAYWHSVIILTLDPVPVSRFLIFDSYSDYHSQPLHSFDIFDKNKIPFPFVYIELFLPNALRIRVKNIYMERGLK